MDIWANYAKRTMRCASEYCDTQIKAGDQVIRGSMWRKDKFTWKPIWHFDCWIEITRIYFASTEYEPQHGGPGRKRMELGGIENWRRRRSLLAKGYRNRQRREWAVSEGFFWKLDDLVEEMKTIKGELIEVGGVPSSW